MGTDTNAKWREDHPSEVAKWPKDRKDHGGETGKRGFARSENAKWWNDYYYAKGKVKAALANFTREHPKPMGSNSLRGKGRQG